MYVTSRIVYLVRQTDGFCKQKSNCHSSKFEIRLLEIIRSDYIASQLYRHQVLVLDFAVAYLDRTGLSIRFHTVSTKYISCTGLSLGFYFCFYLVWESKWAQEVFSEDCGWFAHILKIYKFYSVGIWLVFPIFLSSTVEYCGLYSYYFASRPFESTYLILFSSLRWQVP